MNAPPPEFSRPIPVADLGDKPRRATISAEPAERRALADRFGLVSIERLEAEAILSRVRGGAGIRLEARLSADLVQTCVVTLDPVPAKLTEAFELIFAPADEETEIEIAAEAATQEPLDGDTIDLGEAVAQQLALALDPYPRRKGARLEVPDAPVAPVDPPKANPFGALTRLRRPGRNA